MNFSSLMSCFCMRTEIICRPSADSISSFTSWGAHSAYSLSRPSLPVSHGSSAAMSSTLPMAHSISSLTLSRSLAFSMSFIALDVFQVWGKCGLDVDSSLCAIWRFEFAHHKTHLQFPFAIRLGDEPPRRGVSRMVFAEVAQVLTLDVDKALPDFVLSDIVLLRQLLFDCWRDEDRHSGRNTAASSVYIQEQYYGLTTLTLSYNRWWLRVTFCPWGHG